MTKDYEGTLEVQIGEAVQARQLPPGVVGLIPDGDRAIGVAVERARLRRWHRGYT